MNLRQRDHEGVGTGFCGINIHHVWKPSQHAGRRKLNRTIQWHNEVYLPARPPSELIVLFTQFLQHDGCCTQVPRDNERFHPPPHAGKDIHGVRPAKCIDQHTRVS